MAAFSLINQKYLLRNNIVVCVIFSKTHSPILLDKINEIAENTSEDYAQKVLLTMMKDGNKIAFYLKAPSEADKTMAQSYVKSAPKTKMGTKYACLKCNQKFYDLCGKITQCPACKTPVQDLDIC